MTTLSPDLAKLTLKKTFPLINPLPPHSRHPLPVVVSPEKEIPAAEFDKEEAILALLL